MINYENRPPKDSIALNNFKIALDEWIQVSRICEDNIKIDRQYQLEYLAMLETISAQFWSAWRKEFTFPASWLDAFKIKLLPEWLLRKFPAKVKKYTFSEVIPMLSKDPDKALEQLKKNMLGEFESVCRKPLFHFEEYLEL